MHADEIGLGQPRGKTITDEMERCADLAGTGDDDGFGFGRNLADDASKPGLMMPAFSAAMAARVGPRYSW
ncbi:hypothetical protein EMGBD4_16970 [Verrucomicrobiota bacterium]|nr:hypothetical protein EMGBD4_16970 [Verrucomicrobiota bacterium]